MAYRVVVADAAQNSFGKALAYITEILCAPHAAAKLLAAFDEAIDSLEGQPGFYPLHREASHMLGRDVHWRSVREYRLYFVIDEAVGVVTVFSFLHRKQNALTYLLRDYGDA